MSQPSFSRAKGVQFRSTKHPALDALLARSIDYAGLFPPAELPLESALKNHASYLRSNDAWMLSTFVLPVAKFAAMEPFLSWFNREYPLRISALVGKTESKSDFEDKLSAAVAAIRDLQTDAGAIVSVAQLEIALPPDRDLNLLGALSTANEQLNLRIFCEAPADQSEKTIALLAQLDTSKRAPLGYKLRTGGVAANAFPTSQEIARALVAAGRDHVPIKFTAGLHHPIRQFRDEVKTRMHGFLNVLGAGVLAAEHSWDEGTATEMLEDEDARSFVFDQGTFAWRKWKISADRLQSHRELVTSFGSCSFDEPRDDLRALGLL